AVRYPVRRDGRARRQHLLEHDVALECRALVAAVLLRPQHADPSAGAYLQAELAVVATPGPLALVGRALAHRLAEKLAHFAPQLLGLGRQVQQLEIEGRHGGALRVLLAVAQLDEEAVGVARVYPRQVLALAVGDARALLLQVRHAARHVLALEADEVDALAVLREELADRLGRIGRLQQLDMPDARRQDSVQEAELLGLPA